MTVNFLGVKVIYRDEQGHLVASSPKNGMGEWDEVKNTSL
jgi:hypothetical protein